jgi:hypothetical protein
MSSSTALGALLTQLSAAINIDGQIVLTPSLVPPGVLHSFLDALPGGRMPLTNAVMTPNDPASPTALSLTGRHAGPWQVPNVPALSLSDIDVRLSFRSDPVHNTVIGTFEVLDATLHVQQRSVPLVGTLLPSGWLSLHATTAGGGTGPLVPLAETVTLLASSHATDLAVIPLFGSAAISALDLQFGFLPGTTTSVILTAQLGDTWSIVDGGAFALSEPSLSVDLYFQPTAAGTVRTSRGFSVSAGTTIASKPLRIAVDIGGFDVVEARVAPADGQSFPPLADIASAVGGKILHDSVEGAVQRAVQAIELGEIAVDDIAVAFSFSARKLMRVMVSGHAQLAGGLIEVSMELLPEFTLILSSPELPGGLPVPGQTIALDVLAKQILGDSASLPHLDISELVLFADPHSNDYRAYVMTDEDWAWDMSAHGAGPTLTLQQVSLSAERTQQGVTGGLGAAVSLGGFDFGLSADYLGSGAGWLLSGSAAQDQPVALGTFVGDVAQKLGVPAPTDLVNAIGTIQIASVDIAIDTHDKSFQFLCDVTTKGTVPFGDRSFDVDLKAYISSTVDATGKRSFAGHLEGDLTIGKADFVVSFDFGPAAKVFKASWRNADGSTLSFTDIADALHIPHGADVPKELDLRLKAASFEYQSAASTLALSAESVSFGDAFFTAGKDQSGKMGFVFGVDLPANLKLSSLPGIGERLKPADFLTFKQGAIVISAGNFPSYQLPALPALPPAASATATPWTARFASGRAIKPVATGATLQLTTSGLSLAVIVDFAATSDVRAKNLRGIARADEMMLQLSIGGGGLKLIGALAGAASVAGGKSKLSLSQPRVEIDCGPEVTFQLSGGVNFTVGRAPNSTPVTATARLVINESEAQVAVEISGQQKPLPPPPGIKGLNIESFGVVMGVYFAPPGLDLGLTGNFTIGNVQNLKGDSFGIVLEVLEEAANILYLAFYLDQLDLGEVLTLFTDRNEPALIQSLDFVKASDLAFHWCDSLVSLPDGSIVPPGFGFSASLDVLGFGAHADLEVGITDGIHGHAEIAPFSLNGVPKMAGNGAASQALGQLGSAQGILAHNGTTPSNAPAVLTVSGDGKGITRTYQEINGAWQQVDNAAVKRTLPVPPTRTESVVAAGGPVLQFNCKQAPFVQAGLTVSLFEAHAAVNANVDQNGFAFGLDFDVGNIEKFTLNCTLHNKDHFAASSAVKIGIDAEVGPVHVNGHDCGRLHLVTRVDGNFAVTLDPQQFSLTLDGNFDFQGVKFAAPHLALNVAPARLAALPPRLIEMMSEEADQIFRELFADGTKWAKLVKNGIVTGAGDVATTLKDAYGMTGDQARQAMQTAGYDADTAEKAVKGAFGTVASGVDSAGHTIGQGLNDAGHDLKDKGGKAVDDVGDAFKHTFHL